MSINRLPWPQYFMAIAQLVSGRSTCLRRKVGALAVKDRRILATGYNGAPGGLAHCDQTGCLRQQMGVPSGQRHEICRGLHAEQNIIIQAALYGINISGFDLYCTHHPCTVCAKMLISCQVHHVYYADAYPDEMAAALFAEAGIPAEYLSPSTPEGT